MQCLNRSSATTSLILHRLSRPAAALHWVWTPAACRSPLSGLTGLSGQAVSDVLFNRTTINCPFAPAPTSTWRSQPRHKLPLPRHPPATSLYRLRQLYGFCKLVDANMFRIPQRARFCGGSRVYAKSPRLHITLNISVNASSSQPELLASQLLDFHGRQATLVQAIAHSHRHSSPDFKISKSHCIPIFLAGTTANYTINLTSVNGFSGAVTISCSGLPTGADLRGARRYSHFRRCFRNGGRHGWRNGSDWNV